MSSSAGSNDGGSGRSIVFYTDIGWIGQFANRVSEIRKDNVSRPTTPAITDHWCIRVVENWQGTLEIRLGARTVR